MATPLNRTRPWILGFLATALIVFLVGTKADGRLETFSGSTTAASDAWKVSVVGTEEPKVEAAPRRRRRHRRRAKPYKVVEFSNGGTITGSVRYAGPRPEPTRIAIVKDQPTCGRRETVVPKIRVDDQGRVAEAVVFLTDVTRGKAFAKRDKPPVIDQHLCTFVPHVQAVRAGEPVEIINDDDVAHNINVTQRIYTLFNILQPQKGMKAQKQFRRPGLVKLRCNVHNWMNGYVHVFNHPYYQVTSADGAFHLENVPPGSYELAVWQEYLGAQYFQVKVAAGQTTDLPIKLAPKAEAETPGR